jgi:hypothetical protein
MVISGYLNAENPVWDSQVLNPSGEKLLDLIIFKFQHHNIPPTIHHKEMVK